jgi:eukaryotic-like serine/threonine-protein kinase
MTGQTLAHYRVVEELGAGGMGTVYRAEDLRLQRPVALKVLLPELLAEPGALDGFKREARVAAALNHPNICTIHDVGDDQGRPFVVMELLEGESLRELLHQGPLPVEQVLNLGIGIAEALEAAHAQRIIHRDLKPANVIVSPDGRHAKVLDFGLAQLVGDNPRWRRAQPGSELEDTPSVVTQTRAGAGTPAYASPEQVRGEPLDERSDIFSFGALLYEMASGQRAFPGATPAAVFDAVLNREPAPVASLRPELPDELAAAITRAIEKDREQRYASAAGLAFDLRRIRRRLEGASSGVSGTAARYRRFWRRPRARAAALGALMALVALGSWLYSRRLAAPPLTERDFVLLADFANNTGDPVFDLTLREALAVQLSQSPFLAIVPDDRVRETLGMMQRPPDERLTHALAREVCERTGASALLEGRLDSLGTSYVATLEAVGCSGGESIAREQAQVDSKEKVLRALGPMASSMRAQLGESLATLRKFDVPIEQATTPSLEALKAYALGVAQRAKGDDIGAIPFLEHAVTLDPGFASAHSALSAIFGGLGEPAERASHARLAYESRSHVTERERLFIEYQHYDATGDEKRASEILEIWKQLYPRDYRAPNALALSWNRQGDYERAIAEALEAQRRNPEHPFPRSNLAYAYRGANRFADARRTAEEAIAHRVETLPLRRLLFQMATLDGDSALADATLEWGKGKAREFDLIGASAQAAAFAGEMSRARALYERTAEMARRQGLLQVALGYASQAAWSEALYGEHARAAAGARAVLQGDPSAAPRLRAAAALALAGAPDEAERAIAAAKPGEADDLFVTRVHVPVAQAAVALARRQPVPALTVLQRAQPYELGQVAALAPAFLRGLALLLHGASPAAGEQFKTVLDHRGVDPFSPLYALAGLELARARARAGDTAGSRAAYDAFLAGWAHADAQLPVLAAARTERQALR